jgi:hypothetical protein
MTMWIDRCGVARRSSHQRPEPAVAQARAGGRLPRLGRRAVDGRPDPERRIRTVPGERTWLSAGPPVLAGRGGQPRRRPARHARHPTPMSGTCWSAACPIGVLDAGGRGPAGRTTPPGRPSELVRVVRHSWRLPAAAGQAAGRDWLGIDRRAGNGPAWAAGPDRPGTGRGSRRAGSGSGPADRPSRGQRSDLGSGSAPCGCQGNTGAPAPTRVDEQGKAIDGSTGGRSTRRSAEEREASRRADRPWLGLTVGRKWDFQALPAGAGDGAATFLVRPGSRKPEAGRAQYRLTLTESQRQ